MTRAQRIERARALLAEALGLVRAVMVEYYEARERRLGKRAEDAADEIAEAGSDLGLLARDERGIAPPRASRPGDAP